jgi:peptidoglycan/xylan/chitin deacetylase (PgdA/CDA1 family)
VSGIPTPLKAASKRVLRRPAVRAAAVRAAARRGHSVVLLYHRITTDAHPVPNAQDAIVPSVDGDYLWRHLHVLGDLGEVVDLASLLDPPAARSRPRFAVSFDDDYSSHVACALPVLQELHVPATFFLSGRALHGLGPYWWERLEALVASHGMDATARMLGIAAATPGALAAACETNAAARRRLDAGAPVGSARPLRPFEIRELAAAGMTIGFHTVEHQLLPPLDDEALVATLITGRTELEAVTDRRIALFAYPHGKATSRVARAVRMAGYQAAWTGQPGPIRPNGDRFLLARWEPGPLDVDAFVTALAVRLHRSVP